MKKLLALIVLFGLLLLSGCPKPIEDPEPELITVSLEFDRFIDGVRTSPYGRIAASEADWVHVLSTGAIATIDVLNVNNPADVQNFITTYSELAAVSIILQVGETYSIDLSYAVNEHADGLVFVASSGNVTIASSTTSIPMSSITTGQSLVLLDKTNIDPAFQPRFDDANGTLPSAFSMFESTLFWYVYVEPDGTDPYKFQYGPMIGGVPGNLVEITINTFIPETIYYMSETEKGSILLIFDYSELFSNVITIGN